MGQQTNMKGRWVSQLAEHRAKTVLSGEAIESEQGVILKTLDALWGQVWSKSAGKVDASVETCVSARSTLSVVVLKTV